MTYSLWNFVRSALLTVLLAVCLLAGCRAPNDGGVRDFAVLLQGGSGTEAPDAPLPSQAAGQRWPAAQATLSPGQPEAAAPPTPNAAAESPPAPLPDEQSSSSSTPAQHAAVSFASPAVKLARADLSQPPESELVPADRGAPTDHSTPAAILTLSELEQTALASNPAVAQAAAQVEAARGNWVQVGLPPNPALGYSGQQLGSHGLAEQQGVYFQQEFVTGHKLRLNRQVAAWQLDQAERALAAQQLRVLTDVRVAYYDVLIAQRRRDLTAQLVDVGQRAVDAAEALLKGQEVSQADPLRARIEADTARILAQNAVNQHRAAWRRLAAVVGQPDMTLAPLEGELQPNLLPGTWDEALQQILEESPEMGQLLAKVEAAEWAVDRARAQVIPNLDVQAIVQQDNSTGSSNGNLQVSLPIPIVNRNQGGVRKAEAELAAAKRGVERLALDLQARLADAFQRYENARNQVEKYEAPGGILENAERTLNLISTGYRAGEFGLLDFLSAQRTYFQTNLAYLDSLRELWIAAVEIRGLLLKGSLRQ